MKASEYQNDLNEYLEKYHYQIALTQVLDGLDNQVFDQQTINEIVLWKVNRYVSLPAALLSRLDDLKSFTKTEHRKSEDVLHSLLNIHGVDLAMASTLLRFRNPNVFQIIDRHAYRALYGKKYPLYQATAVKRKIAVYFDYLDTLIELCREKNLNFRTIDRLLYVFDKEKNGAL